MPYPFDPTGKEVSNLIIEQRTMSVPTLVNEHYVILNEGPYFEDSLVVTDVSTGLVLIKGIDYVPSLKFDMASLRCAKPIYGAVSFYDYSRIGDIEFQYQTLGDIYTIDATIATSIYSVDLTPRTINWESLITVDPIFKRVIFEWDLMAMNNRDTLLDALVLLTQTIAEKGASEVPNMVHKPQIIYPKHNSTIETRLPQIIASAFYSLYSTRFSHREFEIAEAVDYNFTTPIVKSVELTPIADADTYKDAMMSDVILSPNTAYLVRSRDVDTEGNAGNWSTPIRFITQYTYIEKPVPTSPLDGEISANTDILIDSGSFVVGVDDPLRPHDDIHKATLFTLYASDQTTVLMRLEVASAIINADLNSIYIEGYNEFYWSVRHMGEINGYSQESDKRQLSISEPYFLYTIDDLLTTTGNKTLSKLSPFHMNALILRDITVIVETGAYGVITHISNNNILWLCISYTNAYAYLYKIDLNDTGLATESKDLYMSAGDMTDNGDYLYYISSTYIRRYNTVEARVDIVKNIGVTANDIVAGENLYAYVHVNITNIIKSYSRDLVTSYVDFSDPNNAYVIKMVRDPAIDRLLYIADDNRIVSLVMTTSLGVTQDYDHSTLATSIGGALLTDILPATNGYVYATDGTFLFKLDKVDMSVGVVYSNPLISNIKNLEYGVDGYLYCIGDEIVVYKIDAVDLIVVDSYTNDVAVDRVMLVDNWV